jgi:hypothetical protein
MPNVNGVPSYVTGPRRGAAIRIPEPDQIRIPEPDHPRVSTLSGCMEYVLAAMPASGSELPKPRDTSVGPGREGSTDPTTLRPVLRGCR